MEAPGKVTRDPLHCRQRDSGFLGDQLNLRILYADGARPSTKPSAPYRLHRSAGVWTGASQKFRSSGSNIDTVSEQPAISKEVT